MKTQQHIAGVLLIGLLVAGVLLAAGSRLASMLDPVPQAIASTGQAPAAIPFTINYGITGKVELAWTAPGVLADTLTAPSGDPAALPDLGTLDLAFLLQKGSGANVSGFVELETSLAFTGYHTISTTLAGVPTELAVGAQVNGSYDAATGVLNLLSQRVAYTLDTGAAVERQFRLTGAPSQTPGVLVGEYRETIWGYGLAPFTIVGAFALEDVKITLAAVNRPPVVESQVRATLPNTAVALTLNGADLEGKPITYIIVTQPANGTLSGSAPTLTYTPNSGFTGADSFTFKVNDGVADSETTTVTITVGVPSTVNNAPTADGQTVTVVTGQAKNFTLTGSDLDGNALSFIIVTQPSQGTLSGSAPALTYTPNPGFVGRDSFTFKVNDGAADSPPATVTIDVGNGQPTETAQRVFLPVVMK